MIISFFIVVSVINCGIYIDREMVGGVKTSIERILASVSVDCNWIASAEEHHIDAGFAGYGRIAVEGQGTAVTLVRGSLLV